MSEIKDIKENDFEEEVLKEKLPVLVDFWAEWCAPCRRIEPILKALSEEFHEKVKICRLNVDENFSKATEFGIRSIPTLFFFKDGKVVDRVIGVVPRKELRERLIKLI